MPLKVGIGHLKLGYIVRVWGWLHKRNIPGNHWCQFMGWIQQHRKCWRQWKRLDFYGDGNDGDEGNDDDENENEGGEDRKYGSWYPDDDAGEQEDKEENSESDYKYGKEEDRDLKDEDDCENEKDYKDEYEDDNSKCDEDGEDDEDDDSAERGKGNDDEEETDQADVSVDTGDGYEGIEAELGYNDDYDNKDDVEYEGLEEDGEMMRIKKKMKKTMTVPMERTMTKIMWEKWRRGGKWRWR